MNRNAMSDATLNRPGKKRRRILTAVMAAILLVLLARAGLGVWTGRHLAAVVSRLEQRYGSLDEGTLRVPPVPAGENRARMLRAAAALTADRQELNAVSSRFMAQRATAPMPAELRAFVETNRAALRVAGEARSRGRSSWEADYTRASDLPPFMDIRALSNIIYLAARLDLEAGRGEDAARTIASGLALSASIRQEPTLIAQLMRMAVGFRHFEAIQRLMTETDPSKASLEDLSQWLVENRTPDPMHLGLLSELKFFNAALARAENGNGQAPAVAADLLPESVARKTGAHDSPFWLGPLARFAAPPIQLARLRYLEQMEHLLEVAMGPRPRPASSAAPARWAFLRRLDNLSVAGLEQALDTGDLFNSALGATELAVALRRYQIVHGQYPDALSALVPAYVPAVPIDSFTGKPPVYARQGAGFRLHAVDPKNLAAATAGTLDWNVLR